MLRDFQIRPARPEDGPALLALTRATPMQADVSLQIEREPDFFALSRARGRPFLLVATADDVVVGCAGTVRRPAFLGGGDVGEIGVIADLKVHPAWRRKGVARALLEALGDHESTQAPTVFTAAIAAGNHAMDGVLATFGAGREVATLAEVSSWQLFPVLRAGPRPPGLSLRPATEADRGELVALLHAFHRRYALAPPFEGGAFEEILGRSPDLSLGDYRVAVRDGRLVAACAAWSPESMKRTRVVGMPLYLRVVAAMTRALPIPGLPPVGELLRFRYLRHPAHLDGHADALRALVREALVETGQQGQHFLLFTCAEGDPLAGVLGPWPRTSYRYRVVAGVNRPEARPQLDALRGVLGYDDAALA